MMGGYGQGFYDYGNMMGGGWFGLLMMLLFGMLTVVGIVLAVVWIVRSTGQSHPGDSSDRSSSAGTHEAVAIAKRRLASGEITRDQFDEIMRSLVG